MARRKAKRRAAPRKRKSQGTPGWIWMLFGLAIGLSVALAVFLKERDINVDDVLPKPQAASVVADEQEPEPVAKKDPPIRESEYDFYDELPKYELVLPEEKLESSAADPLRPVANPGVYEIQAGSFARFADADRRRAELALLGVESRVQKVSIDDKTYHRVRIGPIRDVTTVNALREQLSRAKINTDAYRISG
ncbi:MAG: SPOR domain-containing protein [Pseudomonadota bacterium]